MANAWVVWQGRTLGYKDAAAFSGFYPYNRGFDPAPDMLQYRGWLTIPPLLTL